MSVTSLERCTRWKTVRLVRASLCLTQLQLVPISLNGQPPKSAAKPWGASHPGLPSETWSPGPPTPLGSLNERASVGNFPRPLLGVFPPRVGKGIGKRGCARLLLPKPGLGLLWKVVLEVISRNLPPRGVEVSLSPSGSATRKRLRRTWSAKSHYDNACTSKQVGRLRGSNT